MESSIVIQVELPGAIGGAIKASKRKHVERGNVPCNRSFTISGDIVSDWVTGNCPNWEKPHQWRDMNRTKRIRSHVNSFDEGYGVNHTIIDDGEN